MKDLTKEAINELRQNARSVVRELGLLNDAYFEIGVTLAERHLLIELALNPSPTMGEIAERLLLDKSTISRLISKAVRKGYVQCITDAKDKRKRFLQITDKGTQTLNAFEPIPYECSSKEEFHRQFFTSQGQVYVCHSLKGKVVGGFYLRSNFSGRSNHIANTAYMIHHLYRGKGLGSLLIKASLHLAKDLGFQAMQFNMVLSQNALAVKLYKQLGFNIIGSIPDAVHNPDGSYQDGYVMHRKLNDL